MEELSDEQCDEIADAVARELRAANYYIVRTPVAHERALIRAGRAAPPAQVGREPTKAMTTAGFSAWLDTIDEDEVPGHQTVTIIWQAMYDAAPLTRIEATAPSPTPSERPHKDETMKTCVQRGYEIGELCDNAAECAKNGCAKSRTAALPQEAPAPCPHDLSDQDVAWADGHCALCLRAALEREHARAEKAEQERSNYKTWCEASREECRTLEARPAKIEGAQVYTIVQPSDASL